MEPARGMEMEAVAVSPAAAAVAVCFRTTPLHEIACRGVGRVAVDTR